MTDFAPAPASPERLAHELTSLLHPGISLRTLVRCPAILGLAVVRDGAASEDVDDRAVAARNLLRELAVFLDGERNGAVATLFGLATGSRGLGFVKRRERAAGKVGISPSHFRAPGGRQARLTEALADELYAADSAYRLRQHHRTTSARPAPASGLGVDWLARHQAYRRIWTPLHALRNDLWVLLKFLREEADRDDVIDRLMNIAWRYAQFQVALERFVADYGGLWLLGDVESEFAVADALQRIEFLVPFGEADDSWLRLVLEETKAGELDPFIQRLQREALGPELLGGWFDWAKQCACSLGRPDHEQCAVHRWIAAVDEFTRLLNADWLAVADWYRLDPDAPARSADLADLWQSRTRAMHERREQRE